MTRQQAYFEKDVHMKTGGAIVVRLVLILVMGLLAGVAAWGQAGSTVQSLTAGESAHG